MAQRHRSLIPLARDHYEGLLLVQQLRESDRAIMVGWPSSVSDRGQFVVRFYDEHLKKHFDVEEKALFPPAAEYLDQARGVVAELLAEHRVIEQFIARFRSGGEPQIAESLLEFGSILERHIRKEDRVLFPLIEEFASPEILDRIEQSIDPMHGHHE
jgi:hemerythrin-like domain-containing protein